MKRIIAFMLILCLAMCASGCFAPPVYTVSFEPNGGALVSGELTQEITEGEDAVPPEVSREGWDFDGWEGSWTGVAGDCSVSALWTRLYTVSFDPGEGELDGESSLILREGETPSAPEVSREGYVFEGWEPELGAASADVTYTAKWSRRVLGPEEIFALVSPAVIEIHASDIWGNEWQGSGFFIDGSGTAVTNFHVMVGAAEATALLADGTETDIIGVYDYSKDTDLCLIKVEAAETEFLTFSEDPARTGESVYAIGSPRGYTGSISSGIVSSASRDINGVDCIQITAPVSPGNSGGPLVNEYGDVLGVSSMSRADAQNLNFAVNISLLDGLSTRLAAPFDRFTRESGTNHLFYTLFPSSERERNDDFTYADELENETITAAEIFDKDDMDIFKVHVPAGATLTVGIVFYGEPSEGLYYSYGYVSPGGSFITRPLEFEYSEAGYGDFGYFTAEITADLSNDYYLIFFGSGDFAEEGEYPLYYVVILSIE